MSEINSGGFCEAARKARTRGADIIAHSPTMLADGYTLAHRIVIRDLGTEYVVHMQCFEGDKSFFHDGNYFPKRYHDALAKAWAAFERRSRRALMLEEVGVLAT